ncbi:DUF6446 family protein [Paracoccus lutimaris]|uniref:Histidine kinase n=1 Tax=Paracoccus lutimaris TaxID=1490030 RepID=A0A368YKN7_9RHOB|nr:DUF6446 family protein [Paracoccus lutimaris]RCW80790.1 hypothetical protein DFP89_11736 [Paracoccus lutimaris]
MNGRWPALVLIIAAVAAGGGMWYAQEYAYYDELDPATVTLTATVADQSVPLAVTDLRAIDADSSPIRWRACFRLSAPLPAGTTPFDKPEPSFAPGWFDCFQADRIGADLESGAATAYLSQPEIHPDVDRVIAVYPDGRAYGWHQINDKTPERGVMD